MVKLPPKPTQTYAKKAEPKPLPAKAPEPAQVATDYDLDKLAHAVAYAETGHCKDGTAIKKKNCFGIMRFWKEKGVRKRTAKTYNTIEEGFADFKRIWTTYYKRFPDDELAKHWTGKDNWETWIKNVRFYYYSH